MAEFIFNLRSEKYYKPRRITCDRDYKVLYRFSKENVEWIANHFLGEESGDRRGGALSNLDKMKVFLRYVGDSGFQAGLGEDVGIHQTSVSKILRTKILQKSGHWVKFPQNAEDIMRAKENWHSRYNFPSCLGVIDCTHIRIKKPSIHGDEYINRKAYPSINVQATCNSDEWFTSVDASWPGSVHDSRIWSNSESFKVARDNFGNNQALLLRDERYLIAPWLMFYIYFVTEAKHFDNSPSRFLRSEVCIGDNHIKSILCGEYERKTTEMCTKLQFAEWNHVTDIKNKTKADIFTNLTIANARLAKQFWKNHFRDLDPASVTSKNLRRQISKLSILGTDILDDERLELFTHLKNEMSEIYSTAKICPFSKPKCNINQTGIPFDPDIINIMTNSRDWDELLYSWVSWRDATGPKVRKKFVPYVELGNIAAQLNNFSDRGEMWRNEFEFPDMEKELDKIWEEVAPLYNELHLYTLNRLRSFYQQELETDYDDLIPAHILGNMWGQTWSGLRKILKLFPNFPDVDMNSIFKENNITVIKMFDIANDFFTGMGLVSMQKAYDAKQGAVIEKPKNVSMVCHASAWDFCNGKDFRIKMCAQLTYENFITIHHEMGHIEYFMQYAHLPITYRSGANPGFHEAIGDTIALSVSSPAHLVRIGLLKPNPFYQRKEVLLNSLLDMALERVVFLPYALLLEKWRWDVFAQRIDPDQWNTHYWHYREKYQKVKAPLPRNDDDFDPGSKFHIAADSQYISYFIAHILEFQIFRSLCLQAGRYSPNNLDKPLHRCDLYKSKIAGSLLREGLELGASKHWSFVLEKITGERKLSGSAIMEYFKPLYEYLIILNTPCKKK